MWKAIVFDMDGTLIDSPLCFRTLRERLDIPEGAPILEHLAVLEPEERALKERLLEEMEVDYAGGARLMEGVQEMLQAFRAVGVRVGIFTRNCKAATQRVLGAFDLPVEMVLTREDALPKPDPDGLLRFLEAWKLDPKEMLFVGDFRFDIECGRRAGVDTAFYADGAQEYDDFGADHVIADYRVFAQQIAGPLLHRVSS